MPVPKRNIFQWCRRFIRLPFFITIGAIAVLYFFNDNSAMTYYQRELNIERLKQEISDNRDTLEYYRSLTRQLDTDREMLERVVREHHHMQRQNEDIYIFD